MRLGPVGRAKRVATFMVFLTALVVAPLARGEAATPAARGPAKTEGNAPTHERAPAGAGAGTKLVMMLHGMCGHPENECPSFAGPATADRLLVCPQADLGCAA